MAARRARALLRDVAGTAVYLLFSHPFQKMDVLDGDMTHTFGKRRPHTFCRRTHLYRQHYALVAAALMIIRRAIWLDVPSLTCPNIAR